MENAITPLQSIWIVVTIARQFDGEVVSVRFEKAYQDKAKAEEYLKSLAKTYTEKIQVPNYGLVEFFCERGLHEIEVQLP